MKKTSLIMKIFLVLGLFVTFARAFEVDDDEECLICDYIAGVAVAACESNSTCNHIMKTITLGIIITIVVFNIISCCLMNSKQRAICLRNWWYNIPSTESVIRRGIAGGSGYYTGRAMFPNH